MILDNYALIHNIFKKIITTAAVSVVVSASNRQADWLGFISVNTAGLTNLLSKPKEID